MWRLFVTPNWPVCIATTLSQGSDVVRSTPHGVDEGSYQGQSVPAFSQICHNLSLAKQHACVQRAFEEKVTCAS